MWPWWGERVGGFKAHVENSNWTQMESGRGLGASPACGSTEGGAPGGIRGLTAHSSRDRQPLGSGEDTEDGLEWPPRARARSGQGLVSEASAGALWSLGCADSVVCHQKITTQWEKDRLVHFDFSVSSPCLPLRSSFSLIGWSEAKWSGSVLSDSLRPHGL